jgi:hypothetical protein
VSDGRQSFSAEREVPFETIHHHGLQDMQPSTPRVAPSAFPARSGRRTGPSDQASQVVELRMTLDKDLQDFQD